MDRNGTSVINQDTTRREALLLMAVGAGVLAVGNAAGANEAQAATPASHAGMMVDCVTECEKANRACLETLDYCLSKGGPHLAAAHVRLLLDCAEVCQMTANFMLRGSAVHAIACGACAEICERCIQSCEAFSGDSRMAACADTCRTCAKSCREMAKM